jgi:DNA polymerase III sliding clamp (beta) subunit (PCNA family)
MLTISRTSETRSPKPERETVRFRLNYGGGRIETLTTGIPPEPVPAPGCSFYYTTAPEAYDGFGTKTITPDCGKNSNGKTWRMIQVEDRNLNWQDGRNGSGMHPTISVDDFIKYRSLYVPETTPEPVTTPQPRNPVIVSHIGDTTTTEPEPVSVPVVPVVPEPVPVNEYDGFDFTSNPAKWKPETVLYYLETVCGLNVQHEERTGTDFQTVQNAARAESVFRERNRQRGKASLPRACMLSALKTAKKFGGSRNVGKTVVLSIGSGSVDIVCADSDSRLSLSITTAFQVSGNASATVPDVKLSEIFTKVKSDIVDVELITCEPLNEFSLIIRAGKNEFTIPVNVVADRDNFTGEFPATYAHEFNAGELLNAIRLTEFATDCESSRYALGGLFFVPNKAPGSFDIAGTDSRRLAVQTIPGVVCGELPTLATGETYHKTGATIPLKSLQLLADEIKRGRGSLVVSFAMANVTTSRFELTPPPEPATTGRTKKAKPAEPWTPPEPKEPAKERNAQDSDGKWYCETFRREFVFEIPNVLSLRGVPVEGRFPRYLDVIPRNFAGVFDIDRAELLNGCETVLLSTDEESRGVEFRFPSDHLESLVINAESTAYGKATVSVPMVCAKDYRTPEQSTAVCMDPAYLVDWLKRSTSDVVTVNLIDAETAVVFTDDSSGCYVVMPLAQNR